MKKIIITCDHCDKVIQDGIEVRLFYNENARKQYNDFVSYFNPTQDNHYCSFECLIKDNQGDQSRRSF